ncbi:MAG: glycosyltransferase [Anaerolineales bacterium]|nr:glycosyltransferase [Anaerolineales bacterium]
MKVLIVTPYFPPAEGFGGPVSSIYEQASMLQSVGFDVRVLTTDADGIKDKCIPKPGWSSFGKTEVYYSRCWGFSKPSFLGRFFFAPRMILQLVRLLPEIDLLQVNGIWIFTTLISSRAALFFGKPYVLNTHGSIYPWALKHKALKKRVWLALFERYTLRRASGIQCSSEVERRLVEDSFPGLPAFVIPNAISSVPLRADGKKFRSSVGLQETIPLVLFLGRIHVVKGLDLLLDAAAEVIREVPEAVFAIVGNADGNYDVQIREKITQAGLERQILLPGPVRGNEKWDALMAADVFALPSQQENFGISAAEAMACGIPIVTSSAVGIAEDIAEAAAGLVVERTAMDFSRGIIELLRNADLRKRMGDAGKKLAAEKYNPDIVARLLTRKYCEIVDEHLGSPPSWISGSTCSAVGRFRRPS